MVAEISADRHHVPILTRISNKVRNVFWTGFYSTIPPVLDAVRARFVLQDRPHFQSTRGMTDFPTLHKAWVADNYANNGADLIRFHLLYQNITHAFETGVPGDLMELGVFKGNSAALLSALGRKFGRHTYLFDTFDGFDDRDLVGQDEHVKTSFRDTSLEKVRKRVGDGAVTCVQGYFPESLAKVTLPATFAVVHIDCDLHDPALTALEIFYPRLSSGGLMILHDYGSGHWPGITKAVDEFFRDKPEKPVIMPDRDGTAIIRKI